MFDGWPRPSVRAPASVTRFPGTVSGTCGIGSRSPWPPPFAPPPPLPVARPCSAASLLLWRSLTSHARASSASVPHLPDADQSALQPVAGQQHLRASDRLWLAVPLFWSFGSANAVPAIMTHGGCVVLQESFEAREALALIERERCSVYYGMGNMARALLEHEDHPGRRLGAMRTGLTIGPPEDIAMTIEALGAAELCNVYGSTETYGNCAVTDAKDPLPLRLHSQGRPLPGMTIRIVDLVTRGPLPAGEIGELAVRGYVTPGYFRAPELDTEAFDRDGYFLTGDLGSIEADGRVRFRGRLTEMIKTGGVNVAPLEVEQVLLQYPDTVQAHVVGLPDQSRGEIVAAVVELRAGAIPNTASILAFCRERLASYKVPVRLAIRSAAELPRTPTGKIHKPSLVEQLAANSATWHECKTRKA